jgi:hypothetical protein
MGQRRERRGEHAPRLWSVWAAAPIVLALGPDNTQAYARRGLSPLFRTHINPYGRFRLDVDPHLDLTPGSRPKVSAGTAAGREGGSR